MQPDGPESELVERVRTALGVEPGRPPPTISGGTGMHTGAVLGLVQPELDALWLCHDWRATSVRPGSVHTHAHAPEVAAYRDVFLLFKLALEPPVQREVCFVLFFFSVLFFCSVFQLQALLHGRCLHTLPFTSVPLAVRRAHRSGAVVPHNTPITTSHAGRSAGLTSVVTCVSTSPWAQQRM